MLDGVNLTEKFTKCCESVTNYRTRAIITRGLYTFYPLFEVHFCTLPFGLMYMVSIQELFLIKSRL